MKYEEVHNYCGYHNDQNVYGLESCIYNAIIHV